MEKQELEYWKAVTAGSSSQWVEDTITSLNGNGKLYYIGGEKGRYMRITPAAELQIGTYEHAFPHIGEALFKIDAAQQFSNSDKAFEAACEIGGSKFLEDLFSGEPSQTEGFAFEMKM